jgi:subfamily B ATP-binding cassette protein MsbA
MKIYLRLLKYVYPYRFTLVLAALSMVLVSATTSGSAYIIKPVMDNIFVNKRNYQ